MKKVSPQEVKEVLGILHDMRREILREVISEQLKPNAEIVAFVSGKLDGLRTAEAVITLIFQLGESDNG